MNFAWKIKHNHGILVYRNIIMYSNAIELENICLSYIHTSIHIKHPHTKVYAHLNTY